MQKIAPAVGDKNQASLLEHPPPFEAVKLTPDHVSNHPEKLTRAHQVLDALLLERSFHLRSLSPEEWISSPPNLPPVIAQSVVLFDSPDKQAILQTARKGGLLEKAAKHDPWPLLLHQSPLQKMFSAMRRGLCALTERELYVKTAGGSSIKCNRCRGSGWAYLQCEALSACAIVEIPSRLCGCCMGGGVREPRKVAVVRYILLFSPGDVADPFKACLYKGSGCRMPRGRDLRRHFADLLEFHHSRGVDIARKATHQTAPQWPISSQVGDLPAQQVPAQLELPAQHGSPAQVGPPAQLLPAQQESPAQVGPPAQLLPAQQESPAQQLPAQHESSAQQLPAQHKPPAQLEPAYLDVEEGTWDIKIDKEQIMAHIAAFNSFSSHGVNPDLLLEEFQKLLALQWSEPSDSSLPGHSFDLHIPDYASLYRWRIVLRPSLFSPALRSELQAHALSKAGDSEPAKGPSCVRLEITFPEAYPFKPPFVRIVSPRFVVAEGHITRGGSFHMPLLTDGGWSPANSLENSLVEIIAAMNGGAAEVDLDRVHDEYTEFEAWESFVRADWGG